MRLTNVIGRDRLGAVRPARVLRVYLDEQEVPVADVIDSHGRTHFRAHFLVPAGGRDDAWQTDYPVQRGDLSQDVPKPEPDVLIALGDGAAPQAFVIGVLAAQQSARWTKASRDAGDSNPSNKDALALDDLVWHRDGGELAILRGMPVLRSARSVHVELPDADNGYLLISRGDGAPDERVLLARATLDYLDDLQTRVSELTTQVQSLTSYCIALAAALNAASAGTPATGPTTPVTAGTLIPAAAAPAPPPLVTTTNINNPSTPAGRNAMMARAVRISADPES